MSWCFWLIFSPLINVVFRIAEKENVGWDFWLISFPIILAVNGLFFGGLGRTFATQRNRQRVGFWLGFFFGPSGWLLTLLLPPDFGRCPACGGALAGRYPVLAKGDNFRPPYESREHQRYIKEYLTGAPASPQGGGRPSVQFIHQITN